MKKYRDTLARPSEPLRDRVSREAFYLGEDDHMPVVLRELIQLFKRLLNVGIGSDDIEFTQMCQESSRLLISYFLVFSTMTADLI